MAPGSEQAGDSPEESRPAPDAAPLIYTSAELFRGRKEIFIEHDQETYSLRITSKDKLLLTK